MKEVKQKTLTLTLPFVDFKGTDKESTDANSYKSDGTFFVRNRQGFHEIVYVCKSKNEAWTNPLPPAVSEGFFIQDVEQEQVDKFKELNDRIAAIHSEFISALLDKSETTHKHIKSIKELVQVNYDQLGQLSLEIEALTDTKKEETEKASGGYVDQDVLLQIIKEVKR